MIDLEQIFDDITVEFEKGISEDLSGAESTRFRNALKKDIVSFKYRKKDGTIRNAHGTLKKNFLPKYSEHRRPRPNPGRFIYWDTDKDGFRQFFRANFIDYEKPEKDKKGDEKSDDRQSGDEK